MKCAAALWKHGEVESLHSDGLHDPCRVHAMTALTVICLSWAGLFLPCYISVQWSEDKIKADPFFGRSRVRFRVRPWVSNTIARDHLA